MNLPNKLTIMRMILIPFMMFFYLADFIPHGIGKIVAIVIFVVAALTDMLDGKIARKYNLVTNFGKFLDPIADKILTTSAFLLVLADGTLPHPWGVIIVTIIIAREFMVSALRLLAVNKGIVLAADIWGKCKTMVQMIALPMCILLSYIYTCGFNVPNALELTMEIIAYTLIGAATVLTVISGVNYLVKNKDCLKD
ncbi:MAG: CDP-diacylglycerol--glycerol-3-phosphate 3-phosphatidyltransferase [Clostridiales bacterium]|nr:CDP-diacylglycerol--glycerol-3-phosphate 3-phosphatidyltransferase [Clostridiales bacterium]